MDYYEGVAIDYLRADRTLFVNTECCIQITPGHNPDKGTHWYCDALVADFRSKAVFLCEISYSVQLSDLTKRLKAWHDNWDGIRGALARDCALPNEWLARLRPWLFVREESIPNLLKRLSKIGDGPPEFVPRITPLAMVQPWLYCSWNRVGEIACCSRHTCTKPGSIPEAMAK